MNEIIIVKTADVIPDDKEINRENVALLKKSIAVEGLINPITISPDNKIIAGRHRLEAFKELGIDEIPCCVSKSKDPEIIRIHENTLRAALPIKRRVADADYLVKKYGNRPGRKAQQTEIIEDINSTELNDLPDDTENIVKDSGLFGSRTSYFNAKKIIKECIPEVIEEIDKGALSIAFVYERIVRDEVKKDKQKSFLYKLGRTADAEIDKKLLNKDVHHGRAERRKKRFHIPTGPAADPVYNVIRIAPDWYNELQEDIEALPVSNYATAGVVVVECPANFVASAIKAVEAWGYIYRTILTAYDPKYNPNQVQVNDPIVNTPSWHVIIGTIDPKAIQATAEYITPVRSAKDPQAALLEMIADIFPDKKDSRLDMSSTEPRKGWKVWKLDYATKEK